MSKARLIFSIIGFVLSLLAVFPAPTTSLWKLSIAISEWGHIFALTMLIPFLFPWWSNTIGKVSFVFGIAALLFTLSPLIRSVKVSNNITQQLKSSFGETDLPPDVKPLLVKKLFVGNTFEKIIPVSLTYRVTDGQEIKLDLYQNEDQHTNAPCIVVVHGGAWDSGDSHQLKDLNEYLSNKGYVVAAINYRQAPKYPSPAASEDLEMAIKYLKMHASVWGIDKDRFVVLGRSAGGQIALVTAYRMQDPAIRGAIAFYTPSDMVWAYSIPGNPWILDSRAVLENYLGGGYPKVPENYHKASPLEYVSASSPPTLMIHGEKDEIVAFEHNIRLKRKLDSAGVKNCLVDLPWATHGFDYNLAGPGGQISTYSVEYFLKTVFNK